MQKFNIEELMAYKGNNPLINRIKKKYYDSIVTSLTEHDLSSFKQTIINTRNIRFILVKNYYEFKTFKDILDKTNDYLKNNRKMPKYVSFIFDNQVTSTKYRIISKNMEYNLPEFENEYLVRNFRYAGYKFNQSQTVNISKNNEDYLKTQYKITDDREIKTVKIDKLLGETLDYYHCLFGSSDFFLLKKGMESPVYEYWKSYELDVDKLNKLDTSETWVENNHKYKPHQIFSIKAGLIEKNILLADKTGIGKSKQGLGVLMMAGVKKALIVTFNDDKQKWEQLIKDHNMTVQIIDAQNNYDEFNYDANYYIINYEGLTKFSKKNSEFNLLDVQFEGVLYDECQRLKSVDAAQTKISKKLNNLKSLQYRIGLSATPFEDNYQVFSIIDVLNLKKYMEESFSYEDNIRSHQITYCGAYPMLINKRVIYVNGVKGEDGIRRNFTNSIELAQRIKYTFISRSSDDIEGFPLKREHVIQINIDERVRENYDKFKQELIEHYEEIASKNSDDEGFEFNPELPVSVKLRQFLAEYNVPNTVNLAKKYMREGKKVIIFTHFQKELDMICERLIGEIVWVNTLKSKRWKKLANNFLVIENFKTSKTYNAIVGNIKTLGAGHNIKEGDVVILNSPNWAYSEHEQAMGRPWRLDRINPVDIYTFNFPDTEVEKVFKKAKSKKENMEKLLNLDRYLYLKKQEQENERLKQNNA